MKIIGAILIFATVLFLVDQNNYGGYYTESMAKMIRAMTASFGFH